MDRDILWRSEPWFFVQAASPSTLYCRGLVDTLACSLCQRKGALELIMSCCPKALGDGRHRWRPDQVLETIAESICSAITSSRRSKPSKQTRSFIRAIEKPRTAPEATSGLLHRTGS